MDYLHDLVHVLNSKLKFTEEDWNHCLNKISPNQSLLLQFILKNHNLTDKIAAQRIYKMEPTLESYRHIKRELRHTLSQLILTYRPSNHLDSTFQRAYYHSVQLFAVLNTLKD